MKYDGIFTSTEAERDLIRAVGCPRCGVAPGRWCRNLRQRAEPAKQLHSERIKAYGSGAEG